MSKFRMTESKFEAMKSCVAKGMTNKQIMNAFDCGQTTVQRMRRAIDLEEFHAIHQRWADTYNAKKRRQLQLGHRNGDSDKGDKVALLENLAEILGVKISIKEEQ